MFHTEAKIKYLNSQVPFTIKIGPIVSSEKSDNFRLTPKQKQHNTTTKANNYNELMH